MSIFSRIRKLEDQVEALIILQQEQNCKEGRHKPGRIARASVAQWIECPACYANLSDPKPPKFSP